MAAGTLSQFYPGFRDGFKIPLANVQGNGVLSFGNMYWVNSVSGSDVGNNGRDPSAPLATLGAAATAATAANDDVIFLMPGHAESVTTAAYATLSKSGVSVLGLGNGRLRPVFTFKTSAAAQMIFSGANVRVDNVVFDFTGIDAIVAGLSVTAADVIFTNCDFLTNSATTGAVLGILTAATATRFRIENCRFLGPAVNSGTTTTACIQHESGIDYVIRNNEFKGKMTQAILNVATVLGGLIDSNRFVIGTGIVAITVAAASTPFITNNRINVASGTTPITAAAGFVAGNVYSAAAGVSAGVAATL